MDRFKLALGMHPGLDNLYTETMQRAQHIPEFQDVVLTISLLVQPLPISLLSQLLGIPRARIVNVLIPLQSIIYVPGDDDADVTLFHTSLRDFLLDEQRSIQLFPPGTLQNQKDRLAYRRLQHAVKLAINDFRHITEPLTFLEHQWSYHWRQLSQQRVRDHCHFLFDLGQSTLPNSTYEMAWAFFHARVHGVLAETDLTQHRFNFLLRNQTRTARAEDILLQGFAYLAAMVQPIREHPWSSRPSPFPIPQFDLPLIKVPAHFASSNSPMHRHVVRRSMRYILCGGESDGTDGGWLERLRGYYRPNGLQGPPLNTYDYALENWTFHLAAAVSESVTSNDVKSLLEFLQERHLPSKNLFSACKYRVRKRTLDSNVEAAARFPHLLASQLGLEIARGTYFVNTIEGLTVIDMLKVFWQMRLEDERHSRHLREMVEVHIGDEYAFEISSKRAEDEPGALWIETRWFSIG
ncbi:hypothetical protein FA13DRAFT_1799774 [Coprinellus micaceus]|uniref:Uncharacterized protein n=1 Tax=Coprinellus micaceus TaxID=71717 RepID=A0A4Y7SHZ0_COPMI|nr:hypothetical protein FA13DRAFT_1799774 [Coprinellus micaceus]